MKNILKKLALLAIPVLLWLAFFIAFEPNNYFGLKASATSSQPVARVRAYQQEPGTNLILGDSRLAHFDMSLVDSLSGQSWQNLAFGGASLKETLDLADYLLDSGKLKKEDLACFRPSVCNRLDRNTSGIVAAGRSLPGLQIMSEVIKDRSLGKYYVCVVRGIVKGEARIEGWLTKNEKTNQVSIRKEETPGSLLIRTAYRPLASGNGYTLLEVHLITGRSHQIRAHLASIGHPIAGDPKYGDPRVNEEVKKRFGVRSQMLHAWRLVMPETISEPLSYLAGKEFTAPMPAEMKRMEEMMKSAPKRPANHRL